MENSIASPSDIKHPVGALLVLAFTTSRIAASDTLSWGRDTIVLQ